MVVVSCLLGFVGLLGFVLEPAVFWVVLKWAQVLLWFYSGFRVFFYSSTSRIFFGWSWGLGGGRWCFGNSWLLLQGFRRFCGFTRVFGFFLGSHRIFFGGFQVFPRVS